MKRVVTCSTGALALILCAGEAPAAGFEVCERSEPLTGMACVGKAVGAGHPDAVDNPATLAAFDAPTATLGVRLIGLQSRFDERTAGPQGGGDGGQAGPLLPLPSLHASAPISERARVGLSIVAPFGLGLAYDDDWTGRYFIQEIKLEAISATFGFAYRLNSNLDVGAGVTAQYGKGELQRAVNNVLDGLPDGRFKLEGDGVAFGWNVGAIWRPVGGAVEIGVAYRSGIEQELEGRANVDGIGPTLTAFGITDSDAELTLDLPQALTLEAAFRLSDHTRLIAQAEWADWSSFSETVVALDTGFVDRTERAWRDAYRFGLAVQHRLDADWSWRGGASYETSAVADANRRPDIPTDVIWGLAMGADRRLSDRHVLNFTAAWFHLGDNPTNVVAPLQGALDGDFHQSTFFVGAGVTSKF